MMINILLCVCHEYHYKRMKLHQESVFSNYSLSKMTAINAPYSYEKKKCWTASVEEFFGLGIEPRSFSFV